MVWGVLTRLNKSLVRTDRAVIESRLREASSDVIAHDGVTAAFARFNAVERAAVDRHPHAREALARAALDEFFGPKWAGLVEELFDQ